MTQFLGKENHQHHKSGDHDFTLYADLKFEKKSININDEMKIYA